MWKHECLKRAKLVIGLAANIGEYVPRGGPLFEVWGGASLTRHDLAGCAEFAAERSSRQDPAFGFRQLVDIADRALSPSLADPTTAVQVIDELHDLLRWLALRRIPGPVVRDETSGVLRLWLPRTAWDAYVHLALDEILEHAQREARVRQRVRDLIGDVLQVAPAERRAALRDELAKLDREVSS